MKGENRYSVFNKVWGNELNGHKSIFFLHSPHVTKTWASPSLPPKEYEESIDEMKHTPIAIERNLFGRLPNLQD